MALPFVNWKENVLFSKWKRIRARSDYVEEESIFSREKD